jgi:hypothetical protein
MIGSRLLFGGYTADFKGKPLYAGFLVQDVLLVHDEARRRRTVQKFGSVLVVTRLDECVEFPVPRSLREGFVLGLIAVITTNCQSRDSLRFSYFWRAMIICFQGNRFRTSREAHLDLYGRSVCSGAARSVGV